jgi:hypothetical protein
MTQRLRAETVAPPTSGASIASNTYAELLDVRRFVQNSAGAATLEVFRLDLADELVVVLPAQ